MSYDVFLEVAGRLAELFCVVLCPGLVASYNIQLGIGNGVDLFWDTHDDGISRRNDV